MKDLESKYIPMTEATFYILLFLQQEDHGYSISKKTAELTSDEVRLPPGTMYGALSKLEKDGLIQTVRTENKRKIYKLTEQGQHILDLEKGRIARLYANSKGEKL
ncbi:MAG: PadR family transcriptional regulator [Ileibacterium sp.]|nr:PadR family transcriptional regulator [Ileibacterium sp.]